MHRVLIVGLLVWGVLGILPQLGVTVPADTNKIFLIIAFALVIVGATYRLINDRPGQSL